MIRSFEDYVEKANQAENTEELFTTFLETIKNHGYDKALFALLTDHPDIGQDAGMGIIHNFPSDWLEFYDQNNYHAIDPVILYGAQTLSAFEWHEIPQRVDLTKIQEKCLNYGNEAGLNNGISTYLRNEKNQAAGISLSTSEKKDATDRNSALITAYSNHFYIKYRELLQQPEIKLENVVLTEKERDVLTWISLGKSNSVISDIMNISESTVDFHMRNIFKKLKVNSRILAVVKAITYGLINT